MSEKRFPLDLTQLNEFRATALLCDGEGFGGKREYLIHRMSPEEINSGKQPNDPLLVCQSELQLSLMIRAMRIRKDKEEEQVLATCTSLVGQVMSRRVHGEDFHDSGRENMGYELIWLPGGVSEKIIRALERAGDHGLAALVREGEIDG